MSTAGAELAMPGMLWKQGATLGIHKQAVAPRLAKQFGLDLRGGNRRAIHRHKGRGAAPALAMQRQGGQFLAGAGLACEQHGAVNRSHLL